MSTQALGIYARKFINTFQYIPSFWCYRYARALNIVPLRIVNQKETVEIWKIQLEYYVLNGVATNSLSSQNAYGDYIQLPGKP
jgi:hypothetical protein